MKPSRRTVAAAIASTLALAALPAAASAAVRTVCPSGCDYSSVPAAVTAAEAGDVISISAGTYSGTVTVNKPLTIVGSGADETTITAATAINITPGGSGSSIESMTVRGTTVSGTSYGITATGGAVDNVDLVALRVTNARWGIDVRNTATADGWTLERVTATGNNFGARLHGDVTSLSVDESHFDGNDFGFYVQYRSNGVPGVFENGTILDSSFDGNSTKGIYLEAADDFTGYGLTVDETGTIPELRVSGSAPPVAGIDVNLKYGAFSNLSLIDVTANGTEGTAIAIKARNDAPSYSTVPASLDDVTIEAVTAVGSVPTENVTAVPNGLMLGNALTDVSVVGSRFAENAGAGLSSYVDAGTTIEATENWWGCNAGPGEPGCDEVSVLPGTATIDADPWSVIAISASPRGIGTGGEQTTITLDMDLNSDGDVAYGLPAGTPVHFETTLGTIDPADVESCGCVAESTLTSGSTAGTATVGGSIDGETAEVEVKIGAPVAVVSPTFLSFGPVVIGDTAAPQTVTVTNDGGGPLVVSGISKMGTGGSLFSISADGCTGTPVSAGDSCTFDVTFAPVAVGTWTPEVAIQSNGASRIVPVIGAGTPRVTLAPGAESFGSVVAGSSATPRTFTLTNYGATDLTVSAVSKSGTGGSLFPVSSDTCTGATVAAGGGTCTFAVAFAPAGAGAWAPKVVAQTSAGNVTADVSGTGVAPSTISPAAFDFGSVVRNTSSAPQTFTVTNNTAGSMTVTSIVKSGTGNSLFAVGNDTCSGATIAGGGTCTFTVTFTPTAVNSWAPKVTVRSNLPNVTADLAGIGLPTL